MSAVANAHAVRLIAGAEPVLAGAARAGEALGLAPGELGHAGPPFAAGDEIPRPVLNALAGAALHEGWAGTLDDARRLVQSGGIRLRPDHDLGTVSPMAGVVRPGQTVMRVEDRAGPGVVWATLAEAGRRALRFGVYDAAAAEGLRWLDDALGPARARAPAGPAGVGLGLDAAALVSGGRAMRIHTGIAHRDGATGWIGVGVAEAPVACFAAALAALGDARHG